MNTTFLGNPVTLIGDPLSVGDTAPNPEVTGPNLKPFSLNFTKPTILLTVPSLDTDVCSTETQKFLQIKRDYDLVVASMDLPFAQKRWCGAHNADIKMVSDYRSGALGKAYGVLIEELHLLARAVFIIDAKGIITYAEYVPEISHEPNYNAVP